MTDAGFIVRVEGQQRGPGCLSSAGDAGAEPTVAKRDGLHDYGGLAACMTALMASVDAAVAPNAMFAARRQDELQEVVRALDALHGERGELFPQIALGLGRP